MRRRFAPPSKRAFLPVVLILIMAVLIQILIVEHVPTNEGLIVLEDAWHLLQRTTELATINKGGTRFHQLAYTFTQLRSELGLFKLLHISPFAVSYWLAGAGETASFAFLVLSAVASILLIYSLGKLLQEEKLGLMAALLWSLVPLFVEYSTSALFTVFYFSIALAGVVLYIRAGQGWKPGYLLSGLAAAICLLAIPVFGLALLVLALIIYFLMRLPSETSKKHFAVWVLVLLGVFTLSAQLNFTTTNSLALRMFTSLVQRRESILVLSLFFFALSWGARSPWWTKITLIFTLGLAYWVFIGLQLWPPARTILAENVEGLGVLLLFVPLVLLSAGFLTADRSFAQTQRLISLIAIIIILVSLGYGQLEPTSDEIKALLNFLHLFAGFGFLGLLTLPWLSAVDSMPWKSASLNTILVLVSVGLVYYSAALGLERSAINENASKAIRRVERFVGVRDIYVCPDELGSRLWFLQGYQDLTLGSDLDDNPYNTFPRDIERRDQGVLIIGDRCPHEVSSLFEIRTPQTIGEDIATRILIFYIPGN